MTFTWAAHLGFKWLATRANYLLAPSKGNISSGEKDFCSSNNLNKTCAIRSKQVRATVIARQSTPVVFPRE
jgi:hypothetical protein